VAISFEKLRKIKKFSQLFSLKKEIEKIFQQIEIEERKDILKVGIIGEIFTVVDEATNFGIEKKLGRMGVEVHRKLTILEFIKHGIFPWTKRKAKKRASPYLKSGVGGHGLFSVAEMLEYAEKGFDGVLHLAPMGCMPEVSIRPILQKIKEEKKFPLLCISIDENTSDTGVQTRLEAFVDLLKAKKS
jgi:predicted nucleotide-binding protein (sugar kinase/HSP70/actin superfamily)